MHRQRAIADMLVLPIHEMLDTNTSLAPDLVKGAGAVNM
jgi:hypothetical protein